MSAGGKLRAFVASRFIAEVEREFAHALDARFEPTSEPATRIAERSSDCDVLIVSLDVPLPAAAIDALPQTLRAIATYSVGTDHIDLEAARRRGIAVFNTPGVLADSTAENAMLLMLGAARRATEAIDLIRSRQWKGWTPTQLVGVQLSGRRLGILGMGDIGLRIAQRASAFGMEIWYCNRKPNSRAQEIAARFVATPEELVASTDVLLLAAPSTPETRGIVNRQLLAAARPGSIVVNIARGDLIDDEALLESLRDGRVRAAGLDVFAGEPNVNPGYFDLPNVFMLPHTGSSTLEARLGMGRILIEALESWVGGGEPANRVV